MPITGDVSQKIDAAKASVDFLKQCRNGDWIGNIASRCVGDSTEFSNLGCSSFNAIAIAIDEHHIRTMLGERQGSGVPQSLCTARHYGHFTGQIKQRVFHWGSESRSPTGSIAGKLTSKRLSDNLTGLG